MWVGKAGVFRHDTSSHGKDFAVLRTSTVMWMTRGATLRGARCLRPQRMLGMAGRGSPSTVLRCRGATTHVLQRMPRVPVTMLEHVDGEVNGLC